MKGWYVHFLCEKMFKKHYEPNKFDFCQCNGLIVSQKKSEGILFSAEIREVGSYTDCLLTAG